MQLINKKHGDPLQHWTPKLLGGILILGLCILSPWIYSWRSFPSLRPQHPQERIQTRLHFISCNDGDTCKAQTPEGIQVTLRFLGIDAPETAKKGHGKWKTQSGQPYANEAWHALEEMVLRKTLKVELRGHDIYQRYLALVWESSNKKLVNQVMVEKGYAFAYDDPRTDSDILDWARKAQREAQKNKQGLWGLNEKDRPENPKEYRDRNK